MGRAICREMVVPWWVRSGVEVQSVLYPALHAVRRRARILPNHRIGRFHAMGAERERGPCFSLGVICRLYPLDVAHQGCWIPSGDGHLRRRQPIWHPARVYATFASCREVLSKKMPATANG